MTKWISKFKYRFTSSIILSFVIPVIFGFDELDFGQDYLTSVCTTFAFTLTLYEGNAYIYFWARRKYQGYKTTKIRVAVQSLVSLVYSTAVSLILNFLICVIFFEASDFWVHSGQGLFISLMMTLIITTIYESAYFFQNWKKTVIEKETLERAQLNMQLGALQEQISPHFLFNNLNTLASVIPENPEVATDFVQNLSNVYRYVLRVQGEKLVTLEEELNFLEDYLFLQKIRFSDGIQASVEITDNAKSKHIAPLTLQLLVENAIKHNVVSRNTPLKISVSVNETQELVVCNNLQPKVTQEKSTGLGLPNVQKRYQLLTNREVFIEKSASTFCVVLPLLDPENYARTDH